jgi:hypothetical protein
MADEAGQIPCGAYRPCFPALLLPIAATCLPVFPLHGLHTGSAVNMVKPAS